jgi:hypothetical protein
VDRYLCQQGRLTLIETIDDVRNKIELVRWDRPLRPQDRNIPALQCIVGNIISALTYHPRLVHAIAAETDLSL